MDVRFFNPKAEKFYRTLDDARKGRVERVLELLAACGHELGLPYSRALGKGLFELRISGPIEIRLLYSFSEDSAWILHGFIKKTEQIPDEDMRCARIWLKILLQ